MTRHAQIWAVREAAPPRPRVTGLPAQRGARIEHGCRCRWLLAGTDPAMWRRVAANPQCKVHGDSSDENGEAA